MLPRATASDQNFRIFGRLVVAQIKVEVRRSQNSADCPAFGMDMGLDPARVRVFLVKLYQESRALPPGKERVELFAEMQALDGAAVVSSGADAVGIVERSAYGNLFAKASADIELPLSTTSAKSTLTQDPSLDTMAKEDVSSVMTAGRPSQLTSSITTPLVREPIERPNL